MSKLFENATALYRVLDEAATTETVNGKETRVFRGSITKAFRSLQISQAHYSEVRRSLIDSESITIVRQGSRSASSIIVLHKEPDAESLETLETLNLTNGAEVATVFQELKDLRRLIGSISIPDALVDVERRLQELDNRITKVEQQTHNKGR